MRLLTFMRQCRLPRRARTRHLLFCDCTCRLFPTKVARPMEPDASRTVHSDTGAIERQLANLTTGPPSLEKETLPPKTTLKKKKKKIKVGDKQAKKTKKKKASVEDIPKIAIDFHEEEPFDPNEPTKIRFRLYGIDDFCLLKLIVKFMEKRRIEEQNDYEVGVCMEKKVMLYGNSNPFICRLFSSFQTTNHLCFAMEYCSGGDLRFHLDREKRFPIDTVRFYLIEILCAIRYLHRLGFIYRDLKCDNIMLAANGHIKLVDLGMCLGKIYRQENQPSDFCGTVEYMSPEVIKACRYNQSVDYWALGIVSFELSVGLQPFTGTDEDEICWSICNLNVSFPCFLSRELQSLISQLLIKNPEERLGMPNSPYGKITEHAFFHGIDWVEAAEGRLCPPFVPKTNSPSDTSNFEGVFTSVKRHCFDLGSSCPPSDNFANFEYTNPNMTN